MNSVSQSRWTDQLLQGVSNLQLYMLFVVQVAEQGRVREFPLWRRLWHNIKPGVVKSPGVPKTSGNGATSALSKGSAPVPTVSNSNSNGSISSGANGAASNGAVCQDAIVTVSPCLQVCNQVSGLYQAKLLIIVELLSHVNQSLFK